MRHSHIDVAIHACVLLHNSNNGISIGQRDFFAQWYQLYLGIKLEPVGAMLYFLILKLFACPNARLFSLESRYSLKRHKTLDFELKHDTITQASLRIMPHLYTFSSWKTKLISLGLCLLYLTKFSSPVGLSFFVLLVSILCKLTHTLSTLWTGDQPERSSRSRQMMPLE